MELEVGRGGEGWRGVGRGGEGCLQRSANIYTRLTPCDPHSVWLTALLPLNILSGVGQHM